MFSSISPIEGLKGRREMISGSVITPGLAWGKREVSDDTRCDMATT